MNLVSTALVVIFTLHSTGIALRLEIRKERGSVADISPVTVYCTEEQTDRVIIGDIRSLALETVSVAQVQNKNVVPTVQKRQVTIRYVMNRVVELEPFGEQIWGRGNDYRHRSSVSGVIQTGKSFLSLYIRETDCRDSLPFLCVALGNRGTLDSNRLAIRTLSELGSPVIKGGRRCPSDNKEPNDRCDIYARVGEIVDLRCKATVGLPQEWNVVTWFLGDKKTIYRGDDVVTAVTNSPAGRCSGNLTSTLRYRHVPWKTEEDVEITCVIQYAQPNTSVVVRKTAHLTACYAGASQKSFTLSEAELAGVAIAGFVAMFLVLVLIFLCMRCNGRGVKVFKRNNVTLTKM